MAGGMHATRRMLRKAEIFAADEQQLDDSSASRDGEAKGSRSHGQTHGKAKTAQMMMMGGRVCSVWLEAGTKVTLPCKTRYEALRAA